MLSEIGIVMKLAVVVVLSCVLVGGDVNEEVRCIVREREALVSFKNGLIDEFDILSSWRGEECCNWFGVVCSNTTRNVISLQLGGVYYHYYYYQLRGKISPSLLDLHHLTYLDLSYNDFGGHPIPEFIGSMKQLQHLYLGNSGFSGAVPPHLGNLTNLLALDLSYNYFLSSKNFYWLSSLSLLSYLDLSYSFDLNHTNSLLQILNLRSLKGLFLKSCNISDDNLSAGLSTVNSSSSTSLSFLYLSGNHLTSSAFNWLSNVSSSLVEMRLEGNKLSGQIPNVFERFINLEFLDVSNNMLEEVYLGSNKLTGTLPRSVGHLANLRILEVSYNSLEGSVYESHFTKLHNLKTLDLSFNSLKLYIASNWIPSFQLENMVLAGCNVGPSFPKWIQTQTILSVLDLSSAGIADEVPSWLWTSFSLLTQIFLSHNQITGTIPDLSSISLKGIDVGDNKFSGHFCFASMPNLRGCWSYGSLHKEHEEPHGYLWKEDNTATLYTPSPQDGLVMKINESNLGLKKPTTSSFDNFNKQISQL